MLENKNENLCEEAQKQKDNTEKDKNDKDRRKKNDELQHIINSSMLSMM